MERPGRPPKLERFRGTLTTTRRANKALDLADGVITVLHIDNTDLRDRNSEDIKGSMDDKLRAEAARGDAATASNENLTASNGKLEYANPRLKARAGARRARSAAAVVGLTGRLGPLRRKVVGEAARAAEARRAREASGRELTRSREEVAARFSHIDRLEGHLRAEGARADKAEALLEKAREYVKFMEDRAVKSKKRDDSMAAEIRRLRGYGAAGGASAEGPLRDQR
ncbi:hypothetical protein Rsub_01923 [Raphidocelis subcapitata]|uniref:Uncharacterized protein n=1 Tax=Raphidocelis subcapitata TaxID=307507 RepID=A0A2V0NNR3_9CHLO|nr:hypothetical protein Rsub_01923 [Raphidocelis subcapitata]|eukprot:GBF89206.1 hypothetical protein Rsub_01923 [Raphidocelis subcapitata]